MLTTRPRPTMSNAWNPFCASTSTRTRPPSPHISARGAGRPLALDRGADPARTARLGAPPGAVEPIPARRREGGSDEPAVRSAGRTPAPRRRRRLALCSSASRLPRRTTPLPAYRYRACPVLPGPVAAASPLALPTPLLPRIAVDAGRSQRFGRLNLRYGTRPTGVAKVPLALSIRADFSLNRSRWPYVYPLLGVATHALGAIRSRSRLASRRPVVLRRRRMPHPGLRVHRGASWPLHRRRTVAAHGCRSESRLRLRRQLGLRPQRMDTGCRTTRGQPGS